MPVDPKRVQTVFAAVVEVVPAERAAILAQACGTDAELRERVEALLQAYDNPASILKQPAAAPFAAGAPPTEEFVKTGQEPISLSFLQPSTKPGSLGRLGHYEVLEELGRGGFGVVLRAFDEKLQRIVAIKVMAPEIAATSPARKRFLREARAAAAVRHENVVQIYAVEEQPIPYLVMEYIAGPNLQQKLDAYGPLETVEMLRLAIQIARGVAAAHAQGLIHRDIKPGNILLEGETEPHVKITDFGLARAADDASMTQSGFLAGTPMYMSPEQAKAERLDHRTDLFSMGSVYYVMLSGRPPFRAASSLVVLKRVCEDTPRPISEIIPEAPPWLCGIIGKLQSKDPMDRFQNAQEVGDLLAKCLAELQAHGRLAHPPHFTPQKFPAQKTWWWIGGTAAVVLLLLGLFTFPPFAGRSGTSPTVLWSNPVAKSPEPHGQRDTAPQVIADPGSQFVDSRAYLPLSESTSRKVIDFKEIHGASPEAVVKWTEALEPGFVPIVISDHATADSRQMHAIAVKLVGRPLEWKSAFLPYQDYQPVTERWNKAGYPTIQLQYADVPGEGLHTFLLWVRDRALGPGYLVRAHRDLDSYLKQTREAGHKLYAFVPGHRPNPALFLYHSMPDSGRHKWRTEMNLKIDQLAKFTADAKANGLYVSIVAAYRDDKGQTRFGMVAWENPANLDWAFKADMTTIEYEAELAQRKQEGLRPVSVTSYDAKGTTRYAASWVRYVKQGDGVAAESASPKRQQDTAPKFIDDPGPQYVDSRAYLSLTESTTRKVIDFKEMHAASPEAVVKWAESLEPGFVPMMFGDHAAANSQQTHAIALKLTGRPFQYRCSFGLMEEDQPEPIGAAGYRALSAQFYDLPGKGMHILRLWLRDQGLDAGYGVFPNVALEEHAKNWRKAHHKPFLFVPAHRANPALTLIHTMGDSGRKKWRVDANLPREQLAKFAADAKTGGLFVSIVSAYRDAKGQTRFGMVAWENPANLDWAFKADMTTAEYEAELAQRKREGLRPVSVTSYDDKGITRYAASWVRYVTR